MFLFNQFLNSSLKTAEVSFKKNEENTLGFISKRFSIFHNFFNEIYTLFLIITLNFLMKMTRPMIHFLQCSVQWTVLFNNIPICSADKHLSKNT